MVEREIDEYLGVYVVMWQGERRVESEEWKSHMGCGIDDDYEPPHLPPSLAGYLHPSFSILYASLFFRVFISYPLYLGALGSPEPRPSQKGIGPD